MANDDRILVEFDMFHAFAAAEFLGVIESHGSKTYTLRYFENNYDPKKVVDLKVSIPIEFADALADRTEALIRTNTRFDQNEKDGAPHILDGDSYFFNSRFVSGEAYRGDDHGVPGQMIHAFKKLVKLASVPESDTAGRKAIMDEVLNELNAPELGKQP